MQPQLYSMELTALVCRGNLKCSYGPLGLDEQLHKSKHKADIWFQIPKQATSQSMDIN